jgi:5-hydroxyisourate hydrolase-like protein (transthyretin family)
MFMLVIWLLLQGQLAALNGTVTKPGGSEPLPKATITLAPVAPGQNARLHTTVAEEDGRFTLQGIEPGDYRLTAHSERYGQAAYGQRKADGPGAILTITSAQQLSGLRISMIPTGTIAGRITGRNGEPAVYASVQAMKYTYREGRQYLTVAQATLTDDRGEYRLFWLPPGQYLVVAAAAQTPSTSTASLPVRPGGNAPYTQETFGSPPIFQLAERIRAEVFPAGNIAMRLLEDGTAQEEVWAPVYYPATIQPRLAAPVDVAAGTTRSGIDIVVAPAPVQKVRGRVVGFAPGSTPTVTLIPQQAGIRTPIRGNGGSTVDGSFEFIGVLPGSYYVVARDVRSGFTGTPLPIQVGDGDVSDLIVAMTQGLNVSGRVRIEGIAQDAAAAAGPLRGLVVSLLPDLPGISLGESRSPAAAVTGAFTWTNVAPGDYRVHFSSGTLPDSKPLYLKSARLGLTDVTGGIRIDGGISDIVEIVLTTESGAVEGAAIDSGGRPAANATVVLVPNVARKRSELYRSIVTGADGRFRLQGLTPGDYKLFAWDDVETGAWQDPEFLRVYESKGVSVRIAEKGTEDVQLQVIDNP